MRSTFLAAAFSAIALAAPATASAAAIFLFSEVGADVVGKLSGSLNLTGATLKSQNSTAYGSGLRYRNSPLPFFQLQASNDTVDNQADKWLLESGVIAGTQNSKSAAGNSSGSTSKFEVMYTSDPSSDDVLFLPFGYVSGSALDRTLTFSSQSFQSLGFAAGDYVFTLAGSRDTVTLRFQNASNVPEPGTIFLAMVALGATLSVRRKPAVHSSAD